MNLFFLFFAVVWIACGCFTFYLGWNRTPLRQIKLVTQAVPQGEKKHLYLVWPLVNNIIRWPKYARSVWGDCFKTSYHKRVEIILFVSLLAFFALTTLIGYFDYVTGDHLSAIIFFAFVWMMYGPVVYLAVSKYTDNQDEALNMVGAVVCATTMMVGPFANRRIKEHITANIEYKFRPSY